MPVTRLHHGVGRIVASSGGGPNASRDLLPDWAVTSFGTCECVGDLVQECIENRFFRVVKRVILTDLDSLRTMFADPQSPLGVHKAKRPPGKRVVGQVLQRGLFKLLQIHP